VNPRIYCLDDSATVRQQVALALAEQGEVTTSGLWSEVARWLFQQQRARSAGRRRRVVLVCDMDLVGIRGADFCQIVKRHAPEVVIVAFTGRPEDAPAECARVVAKAEGLSALVRAIQAVAPSRPREGSGRLSLVGAL